MEQAGTPDLQRPGHRHVVGQGVLAISLLVGTPGKRHCIVVSHPLFWCVVCGAYGETAPKLLTKPCRRRLQGKWVAGGMLGQLKVLRSGRHPKTLQPIPPPIPLKL